MIAGDIGPGAAEAGCRKLKVARLSSRPPNNNRDMTERLYYNDSFIYEFDAEVVEVRPGDASTTRSALILDRTAFYPTSGGQVFDTGFLAPTSNPREKIRVEEVGELEDGTILHHVGHGVSFAKGAQVHGVVDVERRRDHMQQHSGQHVLSAAFIELFDLPTVSFHMGEESCSIDLDAKSLTSVQVQAAENLANDVISQDRKVGIRFVTREEALTLGLRKAPPAEREKLRLIEIENFDLSACGGTHVAATGQIGSILLRKVEKVRQGWRVEFVCGKRAVAAARRDYQVLSEAASLCSSHISEVPQQIRKFQEDARASRKAIEHLMEEIADLQATRLLADIPPANSRHVVVQSFPDRDLAFIKLLAQRLTRQKSDVVALLASLQEPPALVFAQSAGQPFDMGSLMKEVLAEVGGRGGGNKDMAQGGPAEVGKVGSALVKIAEKVRA